MTFARAIGNPTKAQREYHDRVWAINACVMCLLRGNSIQCGALTLHHRNLDDKAGQLQMGHDFVLLLGEWHHQGVLLPEFPTVELMRRQFGPSLYHHKVAFLREIGERLYVENGIRTKALQDLQDGLIERGFSR